MGLLYSGLCLKGWSNYEDIILALLVIPENLYTNDCIFQEKNQKIKH